MISELNAGRTPRLKRSEVLSWAGQENVKLVPTDTLRAWRVGEAAEFLLSEIGLPQFNDLFVPEPQHAAQPLFPPYFILGREGGEHPHGREINLKCGCGYFGLSEHDGSVWQ